MPKITTSVSRSTNVAKSDETNQFQYNILGFLAFALLFIYVNRPNDFIGTDDYFLLKNQVNKSTNIHIENYNYDYLVISNIIELEPPVLRVRVFPSNNAEDKNQLEIMVENNSKTRYYTNIAAMIFNSQNPLFKPILQENCNRFLFDLILLEQNIRDSHNRYSAWLLGIDTFLGGDNVFKLSEYYQWINNEYSLVDNFVYWSGKQIGGVIDISIYKNVSWVNNSSIYVY